MNEVATEALVWLALALGLLGWFLIMSLACLVHPLMGGTWLALTAYGLYLLGKLEVGPLW